MPAPHAFYSKMLAERTASRNVFVLFYFIYLPEYLTTLKQISYVSCPGFEEILFPPWQLPVALCIMIFLSIEEFIQSTYIRLLHLQLPEVVKRLSTFGQSDLTQEEASTKAFFICSSR